MITAARFGKLRKWAIFSSAGFLIPGVENMSAQNHGDAPEVRVFFGYSVEMRRKTM